MAIGKVNAYASVTAPQADFGSIALNAQKFQQAADDERLKMAIKLKEKDVKPYDPMSQSSVLTGAEKYDISKRNKYVQFANQDYQGYKLFSAGDERGIQLRSDANIQAQNLKSEQDALKTAITKMNEDATSVNMNVSGDWVRAFYTFGANKNAYDYDDQTDSFTFYKTKSNGELELDANNQKIPLTLTDREGNEYTSVTPRQLIAYNNAIIKEVDFNKDVIPNLVKNVKLDSIKVENGQITTSETILTKDKQKDVLDKTSLELIQNKDLMITAANRYFPDEYSKPKKEYTKEEYQKVADAMAKDIFPAYKESTSKTEDEVSASRQAKEKEIPFLGSTPMEVSMKIEGSFEREKDGTLKSGPSKVDVVSYNITKTKQSKDKALNLAYVPNDGRIFIQIPIGGSESVSASSQGVSGKGGAATMETQEIFFKGKNASILANQLNGVTYFDTQSKSTKSINGPEDVAYFMYSKAKENGESPAVLQKMINKIYKDTKLIYDPTKNIFRYAPQR